MYNFISFVSLLPTVYRSVADMRNLFFRSGAVDPRILFLHVEFIFTLIRLIIVVQRFVRDPSYKLLLVLDGLEKVVVFFRRIFAPAVIVLWIDAQL